MNDPAQMARINDLGRRIFELCREHMAAGPNAVDGWSEATSAMSYAYGGLIGLMVLNEATAAEAVAVAARQIGEQTQDAMNHRRSGKVANDVG